MFDGQLVRYVVSEANDPELLRIQLAEELKFLATSPIDKIETTLLIHPQVLQEFDGYCDFLVEADLLVKRLGLRGIIQIASFHPQFQFANAEPDAVENYTNRSPYPLLHLLREESISKVAGNPDELEHIPARNVARLRQMGLNKILTLLDRLERQDQELPDAP